MANVTIRNLPDELYERLKKQAAENRRSLNQEIVSQLERLTETVPGSVEQVLAAIRAFRRTQPVISMSEKELTAAKRRGRP